jgi:hypothetical protein
VILGSYLSLVYIYIDSLVLLYFPLTMQLLIKLEDNRLIETVGIPVEDDKGSMRLTACVSSQVIF